MSTLPDNELDLEKLFLPAWAQEPSTSKYADYHGGEDRPERRGDSDRRGRRPPRRDRPPGPRRDTERARSQRPERPRRDDARPPAGDRQARRERPSRRQPPREHREPPPPLPEIELSLVPEERGVESLARQIKMTGRAYPLFDIAQLILQKPERHMVVFSVKKNAEGQPVQPLFLCALDDTVWLSEDEAVAHVLRKHFATFYQAERTATEPPKGKYTFVAQCGMSGVVLGPPNYHNYQNELRRLHSERFSRMPFDVYKSRVKIVRDEEVVKKWIDEQSWRTEYICLNVPEALKLANMEAVEKHFRETHKDNILKPIESHTLSGAAARALRSPELVRLTRGVWEDQRRFPLQIATVLSQQFAGHGLQFFKVNRTITHVSVARPHYLDLEATPVSEGVRRIVEFVNAHPKCTRKHLVAALAPSPAPVPVHLPVGEPQVGAAPPASHEPTTEQTAVIADLHWLVHQGHVIEFANGSLETAKKPVPKPQKPEIKPVEKTAEPAPPIEPAASPANGASEPMVEAVPTAGEKPTDEPAAPAREDPFPEAEPPASVTASSDASVAPANETPAAPVPAAAESPP